MEECRIFSFNRNDLLVLASYNLKRAEHSGHNERMVITVGKFRFFLALLIGKALEWALRVVIGRGTNKPGDVMLKICPDALSRFQLPDLVICVTGTNGKTSTSNLVSHLLRTAGLRVVNNAKGSNMAPGLVTALASGAALSGRVRADAVVLEVDERSSQFIYPRLVPTYILCTNLFRDSIKRNGHSEFIFDKIEKYLPQNTTLLLNGNDAISGMLGAQTNKRVFFAVDRTGQSTETCVNNVCDAMSCPQCHRPLHYDFYHYHHIGRPHCGCGFQLPPADYYADGVDYGAGAFIFHDKDGVEVSLPFAEGNLFNVFNVTAAAAVCRMAGITLQQIAEGVRSFSATMGRFEAEQAGKSRVVTMLFKNQNPISGSQSLAYLSHLAGNKDVVLIVTDSKDRVHGHEDISWLYDTDFEPLADPSVRRVVVGGSRCYDVGLRLVLAGVSPEKIVLYQSYETLKQRLCQDIAGDGTVVVYFELYAMPIAKAVRQALVQEADAT